MVQDLQNQGVCQVTPSLLPSPFPQSPSKPYPFNAFSSHITIHREQHTMCL